MPLYQPDFTPNTGLTEQPMAKPNPKALSHRDKIIIIVVVVLVVVGAAITGLVIGLNDLGNSKKPTAHKYACQQTDNGDYTCVADDHGGHCSDQGNCCQFKCINDTCTPVCSGGGTDPACNGDCKVSPFKPIRPIVKFNILSRGSITSGQTGNTNPNFGGFIDGLMAAGNLQLVSSNGLSDAKQAFELMTFSLGTDNVLSRTRDTQWAASLQGPGVLTNVSYSSDGKTFDSDFFTFGVLGASTNVAYFFINDDCDNYNSETVATLGPTAECPNRTAPGTGANLNMLAGPVTHYGNTQDIVFQNTDSRAVISRGPNRSAASLVGFPSNVQSQASEFLRINDNEFYNETFGANTSTSDLYYDGIANSKLNPFNTTLPSDATGIGNVMAVSPGAKMWVVGGGNYVLAFERDGTTSTTWTQRAAIRIPAQATAVATSDDGTVIAYTVTGKSFVYVSRLTTGKTGVFNTTTISFDGVSYPLGIGNNLVVAQFGEKYGVLVGTLSDTSTGASENVILTAVVSKPSA